MFDGELALGKDDVKMFPSLDVFGRGNVVDNAQAKRLGENDRVEKLPGRWC